MSSAPPPAARSFAYHRAVAPMMWVLVALSAVELVVVHSLLAFWWPRVAIVTSLVTVAGIVWLVAAIRSFRRLPVLVTPDRLVMRVGFIRHATVPMAQVAGLRTEGWTAATVKARNVLNLALVAFPNVVVDLNEPQAVSRRRKVTAIAHRLDDPAGFAAALNDAQRSADGFPFRPADRVARGGA